MYHYGLFVCFQQLAVKSRWVLASLLGRTVKISSYPALTMSRTWLVGLLSRSLASWSCIPIDRHLPCLHEKKSSPQCSVCLWCTLHHDLEKNSIWFLLILPMNSKRRWNTLEMFAKIHLAGTVNVSTPGVSSCGRMYEQLIMLKPDSPKFQFAKWWIGTALGLHVQLVSLRLNS